jgi:hypothetical protein
MEDWYFVSRLELVKSLPAHRDCYNRKCVSEFCLFPRLVFATLYLKPSIVLPDLFDWICRIRRQMSADLRGQSFARAHYRPRSHLLPPPPPRIARGHTRNLTPPSPSVPIVECARDRLLKGLYLWALILNGLVLIIGCAIERGAFWSPPPTIGHNTVSLSPFLIANAHRESRGRSKVGERDKEEGALSLTF